MKEGGSMVRITITIGRVRITISIRKSASPIRFLSVDFLVIPEISNRYFLHNKKIIARLAIGGDYCLH